MSQPNESSGSSEFERLAENAIVLPNFCDRHAHILIVRKLRIPESGPWMSALVIAQVLCFQWVSGEGRIWKRAGANDPKSVSLALAEVGCFACFSREAFRRVVLVFRKGRDHAALVSRMRIKDPDWPIEQFRRDGDAVKDDGSSSRSADE